MTAEKDFEKKLNHLDREILKGQKDEKDWVYACAICGSINITMTRNPVKIYLRELKSYYCRDCKYEGLPIQKKISDC